MNDQELDKISQEVHKIHETLWISIGPGKLGLVPIVDKIDERTARTDKRIDRIFQFLVIVFTPVLIAFVFALFSVVVREMPIAAPNPPAASPQETSR